MTKNTFFSLTLSVCALLFAQATAHAFVPAPGYGYDIGDREEERDCKPVGTAGAIGPYCGCLVNCPNVYWSPGEPSNFISEYSADDVRSVRDCERRSIGHCSAYPMYYVID